MGQRILVIDDSRTIRKVVEWVFHGSPFEVVGAASAAEAVRAIREARPHVLLVDYTLPDVNALQFVADLRANELTSGIPIVMLGGTFAPFDEQQARAHGADDILIKPFKTDALIEKVSVAVSRGPTRSHAAPDPGIGGLPPFPGAARGPVAPAAPPMAPAAPPPMAPAQISPLPPLPPLQPMAPAPLPPMAPSQMPPRASAPPPYVPPAAFTPEPPPAMPQLQFVQPAPPAPYIPPALAQPIPPARAPMAPADLPPIHAPAPAAEPSRAPAQFAPLQLEERSESSTTGFRRIRPSGNDEAASAAPAPKPMPEIAARPMYSTPVEPEPIVPEPVAHEPIVAEPAAAERAPVPLEPETGASPVVEASDGDESTGSVPAATDATALEAASASTDARDDSARLVTREMIDEQMLRDLVRELVPGMVREILANLLRESIGAKVEAYATKKIDDFTERDLPRLAEEAIERQLTTLAAQLQDPS